MTNLLQSGDFTLASGARSQWKLECDALTGDDIITLALMIRQLVGPFCSVRGVPRGGLLLAQALRAHAGSQGPHLLVDDVLTTAGSITRVRDSLLVCDQIEPIVGAVVFARGPCPEWIKAVFQMPECFWLQPKGTTC